MRPTRDNILIVGMNHGMIPYDQCNNNIEYDPKLTNISTPSAFSLVNLRRSPVIHPLPARTRWRDTTHPMSYKGGVRILRVDTVAILYSSVLKV